MDPSFQGRPTGGPPSVRWVDATLSRFLDAVLAMGEGLRLDAALRRIVEAARTLVDARYAALGVITADGEELAEFVHIGVEHATVERIGHLPRGHGILGVLIQDPRPLRLADLSAHAAAYGFPDGHPPMRSFLGVPVRVGEHTFGNLYLTEKHGAAEFSNEDEELVIALAAVAGAVIESARLYDGMVRRERQLEAGREVTEVLLEGASRSEVVATAARHARHLAGADVAAVVTLQADVGGVIEAADGDAAELLRGLTLEEEDGVVDLAPVAARARTGPLATVDLRAGDRTFGLLAVGRSADSGAVNDDQLRQIRALAAQTAVALDYARARDELEHLAVIEDRERIGRDLHDTVIQRLFGAGLALQAIAQTCGREQPETAARLESVVSDLDDTIRDVRTAIFTLMGAVDTSTSLRADLLQVAAEAARALGFEPHVRFDGPIDSAVTPGVRPHLVSALRETLANVARHAAAASVHVGVGVSGGVVELTVRDDGRGLGSAVPSGGRGLDNLRSRAEDLGGGCEVLTGSDGGVTVRWWAPVA